MKNKGKPCILIPAYNPSKDAIINLVTELEGFRIIVVNDGSDSNSNDIFSVLSNIDNVVVLQHNKNYGKGKALKTGMRYFIENIKDSCGIVTCDADGQHLPCDIKKIASRLESQEEEKLLLGYRTFGHDVPLRSKIGNILTQSICSFLLGKKIFDTQTGLRGIPASFLLKIIDIKYNRYEFEMSMLIEFSKFIDQIEISTVYIDNNSSSHFNPTVDSFLIYFVILKHLANSIASAFVDYILFIILYISTKNILISLVFARICSMIFNFYIGKRYVFKSKSDPIVGATKYVILAGIVVVFDYIGIIALELIGVPVYIGKIIMDFLLFFFAFFIQKKYIFP